MAYQLYKNLSRHEHDQLKSRLVSLSLEIARILSKNSYVLSNRNDNDYLEISYTKQKKLESYNIGLVFKDIDKESFGVYVAKSKDVNDKRFYKSQVIAENVNVAFIAMHIESLLAQALNEVKSWTDESLTEVI